MALIKQKNAHEITSVCEKYEVESDSCELLQELVSLYGEPSSVITKLKAKSISEEYQSAVLELEQICTYLASTKYSDKIRLDFSIVNDMNYYNGIVFNGFLNGIYECILFGGRYDKLLKRMGRKSGAIGFALYLDLLEGIEKDAKEYDVDVLLLYTNETDPSLVCAKAQELIAQGKSVSAQKAIPEKLRYKELCDISGGEQ
jgi:ATP phosphoribosyltransferase regulatory subunit